MQNAQSLTSWADEVDTATDHDFVAVAQQENAADVPKPTSQPREPPVAAPQGSAFSAGPPFTVYVGNVPYDTAETNLHRFFHPAKVRDVRLLRHSDTNRVKGAFVEFEELKDAEYALSLNGEAAGGRNLRINVAQGRDSRQSSFNDRRGSFGGGFGDRRGSGFSDRGDRGDRGGYDRGFGDRGFDRHDSRGSAGGSFHERRSGGFGGPDRRGPPDSPRGGRGQYGGGSGGGSQHGGGSPHTPPAAPAEPARERPKLVLQPRSKDADTVAASAGGGGSKKSNPFGDAKPVDTQSKLLQIEEIEKKEREVLLSRTRSEEHKGAPAPPPGAGGGRGRGRGGRGGDHHPPPPPPPEPRGPAPGGDGFQVARGSRPPPPARAAKETSEAPISEVVNKFGALDVEDAD